MSSKSLFLKSGSKLPALPDEISAFLGKETSFEGKMTFHGLFRLDGKFEGEIFESGTLIVGESAVVKGKIGVHTVIISGRVEGDLFATARVEVHSSGKFYGNVLTPTLIVHEGGVLEGCCKMEKVPREADQNLIPHKEDLS